MHINKFSKVSVKNHLSFLCNMKYNSNTKERIFESYEIFSSELISGNFATNFDKIWNLHSPDYAKLMADIFFL